MLQELINKAEKIEAETDANISGACIQATANLSIEQCEALFLESGMTPKRVDKHISRVRDNVEPKWFNINTLRQQAEAIIRNTIARQRQ